MMLASQANFYLIYPLFIRFLRVKKQSLTEKIS